MLRMFQVVSYGRLLIQRKGVDGVVVFGGGWLGMTITFAKTDVLTHFRYLLEEKYTRPRNMILLPLPSCSSNQLEPRLGV